MELDQEKKEHGRTPTIGEKDKVPDKQSDDGDGGGDNDDDEGTRQPYNCTYCRRGFPTAQALGGHMNVHRKDRVVRPAMATATSPRGYHEEPVAFTVYGQVHPASSTSSESLFHAERAPQELRLFGRDGRRSRDGGGVGDRREYTDGGDEGKEELDLELRLGGAS